MPEGLAERLAALRPKLHRYAARMMGSSFDGEDVVQDAMARLANAELGDILDLDAWMFRATHSCAIDALRRRRRQAERDARGQFIQGSDAASDSRVAIAASLAAFLRLPPGSRSAVALVDVLGHSVEEAAGILSMTKPAIKAALHRGRRRLREIAREFDVPRRMSAEEKAKLQRYADRFNAHDWDALRAMLAEDVRLDLVNRTRLAGARDVGIYFTRYQQAPNWRVDPGMAEGRPVLLFRPLGLPGADPAYVVLLEWEEGRIARIRDFHYATYVMDALAWGD